MNLRHEKQILWVVIGVSILITGIPYILGFSMENEGIRFGGFVIASEDGNNYIAKMMSGYSGDWLFKSSYTVYPQKGMFIHLPYILLGKLAGPPELHDQMVALFQLYRAMGVVVMSLGLYQFLCLFLKRTSSRMIGIVLGIFGGGLGWIFILPGLVDKLDYLPLDFYSPEAFGFITALAYPHNAIARGLMLLGIASFILRLEKKDDISVKLLNQMVPGMFLFFAGFLQPLNAAIGVMVVAIIYFVNWIVTEKKIIKILLLMFTFVGGGIWAGYMVYVSIFDTFFIEWTKQNQLFSPKVIEYLIAYSIVIVALTLSINKMRVAIKEQRILYLILWIAIIPLIAYFPHNFQRRLPEGSWCAIIGLVLFLFEQNAKKTYFRRTFIFTGLSVISSILLIVITSIGVSNKNSVLYIPTNVIKSYKFLSNIKTDSIVLSSFKSGNEIPAWAPVTVVNGLKPETIFFNQVQKDVANLYSKNTNVISRNKIINKYQIDYIYLGPSEKEMGSWIPQNTGCYKTVFDEGDIQIIDVKACHP